MYSTTNYIDGSGDRTVIGGELDIVTGGKITANGVQANAIANPTDLASALTAIANINALLKALGATK
jgi:hypothetical protein